MMAVVVAVVRQGALALLGVALGREDAGVGGVVGLLHAAGGVGAAGAGAAEGVAVVAGGHGRVEVDEEGEDVEGEDEGDGPLENRGRVVVAQEVGRDEGDGQDELDEDEGQLDPEGDAEDTVLAILW